MEVGQDIAPFFSRLHTRFQPVPADRRIQVEPFLVASRNVLELLGRFDYILGAVKSNVGGDINTLWEKYTSKPDLYNTLNDMMEEEDNETNDHTPYVALLWLKRALDFVCYCFSLLVIDYRNLNDSASLADSTLLAYERTLEPYHNFFVRIASRMLIGLVPDRNHLCMLLTGHPSLSKNHADEIEETCRLLAENLSVINQLYPEEERSYFYSDIIKSEIN